MDFLFPINNENIGCGTNMTEGNADVFFVFCLFFFLNYLFALPLDPLCD